MKKGSVAMMAAAGAGAAIRRASDDTDRMVSDLQRLIRQPSVSATGEGLEECAGMVCEMLADAGLEADILRLGRKGRQGAAPPVVYAERISKSNPKKTLLFYNHYDVQPAEPLDMWRDPPFAGVRRGNRVYGRGAIDDKGELAARLLAVGSYIRETGDVPCSVKFVIEGEEETGSGHMHQYISKYRKRFACDGVIWEFGYVNPDGRPVVGLGMKGLMFVELTARGPVRDAHSSLAVLIRNPAWRLIEALGSMRMPDGTITIQDWHDGMQWFDELELGLLNAEPFDEERFKREFGIKSFVGDSSGLEAKAALAGDPTFNIAGMASGHTGSGAKTVLPATATVKLDIRLAPGMEPARQFERLQAHLARNGFAVDISARMLYGEAAARTDPREQIVAHVEDAARRSFRAEPVLSVSNSGTGPMHAFRNGLGVPCVSIGGTYIYSRIHSPNEFARIDLLKKTAACMCRIMANLGRAPQ